MHWLHLPILNLINYKPKLLKHFATTGPRNVTIETLWRGYWASAVAATSMGLHESAPNAKRYFIVAKSVRWQIGSKVVTKIPVARLLILPKADPNLKTVLFHVIT